MDWIIEDTVAIGDCIEAKDAALLQREGVKSVLSLDGTLRSSTPGSLPVERVEVVELVDGPNDESLFERAVGCLTELISSTPPVLVQCSVGVSRSVAVVAGYLMEANDLDVRAALDFIEARHTTGVSIEFIDSLQILRDRRS